MLDLATTRHLAAQLRVDAVRLVARAGSGHPTSSLSAADLTAVLLARHFRYDFDRLLDVAAMPTSGEPAELLRWAGIDRTRIVAWARALVRRATVERVA